MKKKLLFLIFVLVSLFWIAIPSWAATSEINERDTQIFGLLPRNQNDALSWNYLDLKCNVQDVSDDDYFYRTANEATAKYEIVNMNLNSVNQEFVLPYFEIENSADFKLQKTSIVVNGEKIIPSIRYASAITGAEFYYNGSIPLYEEYLSNEKFNTNTSVHKITAKVDVSNLKENASYQFDVNVKRANGSLMVAKNLKSMSKVEDEDDLYTLTFSVNKKSSLFELYFIGEASEFTMKDYENLTIEETDGNLLSFANFQLPDNISLTDWFNIIVNRLNTLEEKYTNRNYISFEELTSTHNVMSLLVFSVHFDPFAAVTIETTTPFYVLDGYEGYHITGYFFKGISSIFVSASGYAITYFFGGKDSNGGYSLDGYEFKAILDANNYIGYTDTGLAVLGGILTFFFYIIPMIIMVILFVRRRDKKELAVVYTRKFLSYTLGFFGLLFLIISDSDLTAGIVLLCLFGVLTIFTLIYNIRNNCKDFGCLVLEALCWVFIIYNVSTGEVIAIFGALLIFCFVDFVFVTSKIRKLKFVDPSLPKNCLPIGILYPAEYWIIFAYCTITLSVSYVVSEIINQIWFFIGAFIVIFVGYFVGMVLRLRYFFLKPFRKFYKDLDLDALEQSVQNRITLPNVHPETINFYNILMVKHCLAHSKEKSREYFKKAYLPKTKGYVLQYRGLLLRYGLTKEEFDHAYDVLKKEFYNKQAALKNFDKFYNFWSPYYGTNPTVDISKIYKVDRKNNAYSNAISLFLLIHYYNNQKNTSKVRELKYEFLKKYSILTEFVNDLNEL